jgi:hypothetical protein
MKLRDLWPLCGLLLLAHCAPAPPPPRACCTLTNVTFFDPGTATLSDKNTDDIAQTVKLYEQGPQGPILVIGGADPDEIAADPAIGDARAHAAAAQLEADGIAADKITVQDDGAHHPIVKTPRPDGIISNRYIMIRFAYPPPGNGKLTTDTPQRPPGAPPPPSAGPYQVQSIVLYQPNAVLISRLGPQGAAPLAHYVALINAAVAPLFAAAPPQAGMSGALVIGLKPGGAVRSWVAEQPGALPPPLIDHIETAIDALSPVPVQNGPVAFAIRFNAWNGGPPITDATHPAPIPAAWLAGATGPETVPDGVFARIWP